MVNGKWDLANGKPVDLSFSICHLPFAICDSRRRIVLQEPNVTPTSNCTQVPELICRATDCTHQKACHELHEFHETGQARAAVSPTHTFERGGAGGAGNRGKPARRRSEERRVGIVCRAWGGCGGYSGMICHCNGDSCYAVG